MSSPSSPLSGRRPSAFAVAAATSLMLVTAGCSTLRETDLALPTTTSAESSATDSSATDSAGADTDSSEASTTTAPPTTISSTSAPATENDPSTTSDSSTTSVSRNDDDAGDNDNDNDDDNDNDNDVVSDDDDDDDTAAVGTDDESLPRTGPTEAALFAAVGCAMIVAGRTVLDAMGWLDRKHRSRFRRQARALASR